MKEFNRYLVTAALPYANGPVHIGHLAGVYIPADIYCRYLRLRGKDVLFICGSDEHGVPITIKAKDEGVSPQVIVDKYHKIIKDSFERFGISFSIYSRTSSKVHYETASYFFEKLYKDGIFIEKTTEQYFDEGANQFLADRYIVGTCPHCGNERAYGDQCESCGTQLNATELKNPRSMLSGNLPVLKETNHWYLPLNNYEPFLKEWILDNHKEWKTNVYGQCKSWLDLGLQPRAVSRDLDWGVPVPVEGAEGKVLYVWFDAPIGYISATKELTPDWEKYWKSDDTKLVHFIGKDNIVFHCIVFPAILKAEGSFILPDNVPANEFLNLEGEKISTSRNWAVWLHEYLTEFKDQEDVLRYVLTANAPETKDNDFTWKDFQARNDNELVSILGNFVNRVLVLNQNYFQGKVPEIKDLTNYDKQTIAQILEIKNSVEHSIENFRFREALKLTMDLARLGNKYLTDTEPWKVIKTDEPRVRTILGLCIQITANIAALIEPFLPFSAKKLLKFLNFDNIGWENIGRTDLIPVDHQLNQPELLFAKIDDSVIEAQINKLMEIKKANELKSKTPEPQKPNVGYDVFQKLDIRIGTIIAAEKVAKTKKLLKLTIDTGIDKRTIVSGIAEAYKPEEIIGKQVTLLINLQPQTIKGIESQGMILTAENLNGELSFVSPVKELRNGAVVK